MRANTEKKWHTWLCLFLAVFSLFVITTNLPSASNAQTGNESSPDNGILVFPVQISRDSHGMAMVDTIGQNLWIYKFDDKGSAFKRLELFAARSFKYDRLLQQYNTAEPKPEQVKLLLENLGLQNKK